MTATDVAVWAIGGTSGAALLTWLIRHLFITVFSGKSEVARIQASDAFATRLTEEIARLEGIINKLNEKVASLQAQIDDLRSFEIADMSDVAEINAIVRASCMNNSKCPANQSLMDILNRIKTRHTHLPRSAP